MTSLMSSQDRALITQALVTIMRARIDEDERRERLVTERVLFAIEFGTSEEGAALWNSVWADVMAQTDGRQWNDFMKE
jgi:hypothetical protein